MKHTLLSQDPGTRLNSDGTSILDSVIWHSSWYRHSQFQLHIRHKDFVISEVLMLG